MYLQIYDDIKNFYNDTYNILLRNEAQNLIPLGNIIIGYKGIDRSGWKDPVNWLMATVKEEEEIKLVAIMTPPHNITLYSKDNIYDDNILNCLIDNLPDYNIPGVTSNSDIAERFAQIYTKKNNLSYFVNTYQRIYELEKVNQNIKIIGNIRPVKKSDISFLPYWKAGFFHDSHGNSFENNILADDFTSIMHSKKLFILEVDGICVSMASLAREMQTVCGVNLVYTPPYLRGNGYATSVVSLLSQKILDSGFLKCVLYTNLDNPISNSIYQKIGYKPICDSLEIKFKKS